MRGFIITYTDENDETQTLETWAYHQSQAYHALPANVLSVDDIEEIETEYENYSDD